MSLRTAFAVALKFLRVRRQLSQLDLAKHRDQSYISRLESGANAVTLEVSNELAQELKLDPMSLLAVTYAAERGQSPREVIAGLQADLEAAGLLDASFPLQPDAIPHPVVAEAQALNEQILAHMVQGLSQAETARRLGVSRETVSRHLRKGKNNKSQQ